MEMILFTDVICEVCKITFSKKSTEVNRSNKLGRKHYCSLSCSGKGNFKNIPIDKRPNPTTLPKRGRWRDELSPFRWHLRNAKKHSTDQKIVEVDLHDLKNQWDKQKGMCPYTNWNLLHDETFQGKTLTPKCPQRASLDRIDSSKGYTIDNIQFVSLMAQYAKNEWHEEELIKFCQAVNGQFRR